MPRKPWDPDDVASISARNRAAWAEQEAMRAATLEANIKRMGQFAASHIGTAEAIRTVTTSGDQRPPSTHPDVPAGGYLPPSRARRSGSPGPLTPSAVGQAAPRKADAAHKADAASTGPTPCLVGKTTSKYGNVHTNGYASKKEAARASQLRLMQEAGAIRNLREQVRFLLIPKQVGERACEYVADFVYEEWGLAHYDNQASSGWRQVVEDCKGMRTDIYRLKKKLLLFVHGIRIRET